MAKQTSDEKTYIMELSGGGVRKVTVPATWKITFGPTCPGSRAEGHRSADGQWSLRFYEGNKENLRAIFTDVKAFRDSSLSIIEKRISTHQRTAQKKTATGMKDVLVMARVEEWVNPDDPTEGGEDDGKLLLQANGTEEIPF